MEKKLILKRYGLYNPTEVEYGDKILVTNQLDVKSTCDLWKRYFGLRCYERIPIYVQHKRDYDAMRKRTLASVKSVKELFYEQGFDVVLLEHESEIVSDWKLYRKRDELCDREEVRKETAREILDKVYQAVESARLNSEYQDKKRKWVIDEYEFMSEFTLGALHNLYKEYGIELFGKTEQVENFDKLEDGE